MNQPGCVSIKCAHHHGHFSFHKGRLCWCSWTQSPSLEGAVRACGNEIPEADAGFAKGKLELSLKLCRDVSPLQCEFKLWWRSTLIRGEMIKRALDFSSPLPEEKPHLARVGCVPPFHIMLLKKYSVYDYVLQDGNVQGGWSCVSLMDTALLSELWVLWFPEQSSPWSWAQWLCYAAVAHSFARAGCVINLAYN